MRRTARRAGLALTALIFIAAGCGSDGDAASSATTKAPTSGSTGSSGSSGSGGSTTAASGGSAAKKASPCSVVTQQQWETLFGAGVKKADASGGANDCNVLTSGTSPGHEVEITNFSANLPNTSFDAQVGYNPPCGATPAKALAAVGDKAVIDTSCLAVSGKAWVIAEKGGKVYGVFVKRGEPVKGDVAAIESTLATIAKDALGSV